uniref:Right handed beta helix domain-containing protein n=1 Tax=Zooxanthella nutricula TaxID=1333877 RepID=A0A7S2NIU8_9DINO
MSRPGFVDVLIAVAPWLAVGSAGDAPPAYDAASWKGLITGSDCPIATTLNPKGWGRQGGELLCERTGGSGRHFRFPPGMFDIDEQVVVPAGTTIEGNENPNDPSDKTVSPDPSTQTFFVATSGVSNPRANYCGTNGNLAQGDAQRLRIGFLLLSNTVVKNINFQGKDTTRPWDNGSLCGGAAFETPGCVSPGFSNGVGNGWVGKTGCFDVAGRANNLITGDGKGVENVVIDSVRLNDMLSGGQATQIAVWVAQTQDGSATKNVRVTNLVSMLTRGDGINFHGNVQDSVVEDSRVENTGDDIFAVWGGYATSPAGIVFRNNVGKNAGVTRNYGYGVCIAVYGAMDVTFTGNKCYDPPMNHACQHGAYCNSCMAYVHDLWFGAVYPQGDLITFHDNEYLSMEGVPITDRPSIRTDKGSNAHIASS